MPEPRIHRRDFLTAAAATAISVRAARAQPRNAERKGVRARRPLAISSSNGLGATRRAVDQLKQNADPLDAVVHGVRVVEDDPEDMTVGLGGLPNEDGVVQLDSSVMHGPEHRAGSVGALERIKNPAAVAREVARRTDHVMLVGDGALKFARRLGFEEQDLLTDKARKAWLRWKAADDSQDDWLTREQFDLPGEPDKISQSPSPPGRGARGEGSLDPVEALAAGDIPHANGTIHCSAVTPTGDLAGVTTTSGLSWKIPGRVGDSPIIGAGLYTDNEIGSAGATGRGEAVIQTCGAHTVVERMAAGDEPTEACLHALKRIADRTRAPRLLDSKGRPNFNVVYYAVRADGAYGSACMWSGRRFAVSDEAGDRREDCAFLYERT